MNPCGGGVVSNSTAFVAKSYFSAPKPAASVDNDVSAPSGLPQEGNRDALPSSDAAPRVARTCAGQDDEFAVRMKNAVPGLFMLMRCLGMKTTNTNLMHAVDATCYKATKRR